MGLLDAAMPQMPQQAQQMGQQQPMGLLGSQTQSASGHMPPEVAQAIQQMKSASPQQKQVFLQKMAEQVNSSKATPENKQLVMTEITSALQGGQPQPMQG